MRTLLILLALSCAAIATATPSEPSEDENWSKLSSEHFEMYSCKSEPASIQLLVRLEQFRAFYIRIFPNARICEPEPLIFVFDTKKHYTQYLYENLQGETPPSDGSYMSGRLQSWIMTRSRGYSLLFHEYAHFLGYNQFGGPLPPWFSEGRASVFENIRIRGDSVTFGKPLKSDIQTISSTPWIPLSTLFTVNHKSPYYNRKGSAKDKFYAQSWLLLHYMMLGKNNEPYTMENLMRFATGTSHSKAFTKKSFKKIFGSDYKALEDRLPSYLRAGEYSSFATKIPEKPIRDKITIRAATIEECEIELAGLLWRSTLYLDAQRALFKLANKYPDNPRVYEILAEAQIRDYDNNGTANYLAKAIEKNTTNPKVYVELLKAKNVNPDKPGCLMTEKEIAEYRALVDRAIELDSDCMEAYELLAIIESKSPNIRIKKVNAVLEALPYMRERDKTHYALATVYWRLKRHDEALAVINELMNDPKSSNKMKRWARELQRLIVKETGKSGSSPTSETKRQ